MKSIQTLLKLRRLELDEKSKELLRIRSRINEIEDLIKKDEIEMKHEIALANGEPGYSLAWRAYFDSIKARQVILRQHIKSMESAYLRAQEEVKTAFQNTKSVEIIQTNILDGLESKELKRELREVEDMIIQRPQKKID